MEELFRLNEDYSEKLIYEAWKKFINEGVIDRAVVRPIVAESWERSKKMGIDPFTKRVDGGKHKGDVIGENESNRFLVEVINPFLDILSLTLRESRYAVSLFDRDGYKLRDRVSGELKDVLDRIGNVEGVNFSERFVGTNGVGLALLLGSAVQLVGAESFIMLLHPVLITSVPIRDSLGNMVGVLSVSCWKKPTDVHTLLAMVVSAVAAIENNLKLNKAFQERMYLSNLLEASIENISDGLISIDSTGVILEINPAAENILGLKKQVAIGKKIFDLANLNPSVILEEKKRDVQKEAILDSSRGRVRCLLNITPLHVKEGSIRGFVIIIREIKKVHRLVTNMIGAQAIYEFSDIIGESLKIENVKEFGRIASRSSSNVLILGEHGTGKELLAHAIHNSSKCKDHPFVPINCAAIPSELFESELFGYEAGAFTGALKDGRPGKFELADGGTIFFDEIGDMPLMTQAKILRILEEKYVVRVGGVSRIPINVRIIAATNKDIKSEIEKGNFREDLFYRLNVLGIHIPPLRERKEDIPLLVDHIIKLLNRNLNKEIRGISGELMERLMKYNWPGNVRELKNIFEKAANFTKDGHLSLDIPSSSKEGLRKLDKPSTSENLMPLKMVERDMIARVMESFNGNKRKTARVLGIGRTTLYRKLKELNL